MSAAADARLGTVGWPDNWTLGAGLRMEIINSATADVWLCQDPVDREHAEALALPDGYRLVGLAEVAADEAFFARSPDAAADGPLESMVVDGLRFHRVARPVGQRQAGSVTVLSVHKQHSMLYRAGRTIEVIDLGDGTVLLPAWTGPRDSELVLAEGWSVEAIELADDLIARIPDPAMVAVVSNGSGFHGPVLRAAIDAVKR